MDKYINFLKEMLNNFSYHQFIDFLHNIDNEIIKGNIIQLNAEFIYYLKEIINMVNDQYIVDYKIGTLGHMLVENALLNKERLSPMLAICFFLEQKANIGLDTVCNEVNFSNLNEEYYRMMITDYHDGNNSDISINLNRYFNSKKNVDEFNYDLMFDLLHELTHVYQLSRDEQTENIFDRLAYYDYQKDSILNKHSINNTNIFFHQSLLTEFMADEQAYVFMLQLGQTHPEYFNNELIRNMQIGYQKRKNGTYGDYGANPREAFASLISDIKKAYAKNSDEASNAFVKSILEEIEVLNQKAKPLLLQLQSQGISEKAWDSYYNIYLKSLYRFDGENIIINNDILKNQEKYKMQ